MHVSGGFSYGPIASSVQASPLSTAKSKVTIAGGAEIKVVYMPIHVLDMGRGDPMLRNQDILLLYNHTHVHGCNLRPHSWFMHGM